MRTGSKVKVKDECSTFLYRGNWNSLSPWVTGENLFLVDSGQDVELKRAASNGTKGQITTRGKNQVRAR